jgi:hypothetical protein
MTPRNFDTHIRINPDAIIQSYYSDRLYKGSDLPESEFMAVLEGKHYVFRFDRIAIGVAPDDVEILQTK